MGVQYDRQLAAIFKALGDETRLLMLDELRHRDHQTLFEICTRIMETHGIALTRQAISRHLGVLESAGLIVTEWRGRTKVHSLNIASVEDRVQSWLSPYSK